MKLIKGDMWNYIDDYDIILITTNGFVKRNGECVMGRGNALQAKIRYPFIAKHLGRKINNIGNIVHPLVEIEDDTILASFPVKDFWYNEARLDIIEESCRGLIDYMNKNNLKKALLPVPGVGSGKLNFNLVIEFIKQYLDDRVHLIIYSDKPEEIEV